MLVLRAVQTSLCHCSCMSRCVWRVVSARRQPRQLSQERSKQTAVWLEHRTGNSHHVRAD